eukprot:gene18900-24700_t
MCNTLLRHYFGKDWRFPSRYEDLIHNDKYLEILQWFTDYPGPPHFYSIHHLVQCGVKYGKLPGEWFGPSTIALVLRDITEIHRRKYYGELAIYVTNGDTIYTSDIQKLCVNATCIDIPPSCNEKSNNSRNDHKDEIEGFHYYDPLYNKPNVIPKEIPQWHCSLMILIPLLLGVNNVNKEYIEEIKCILNHKHCVGIIGGRPNHALYFVGYNCDNQLLGHDPHTVYGNPIISMDSGSNFPTEDHINQVHVNYLQKLDITRLDPSLAIGFYFHNSTEYSEFYDEIIEYNKQLSNNSERLPLFHVSETAPSYMSNSYDFENSMDDSFTGSVKNSFISTSFDKCEELNEDSDDDEDDYVILA